MKLFRIEDMTRGWFVGGFEPTAFYTRDFEVGYRIHFKDSTENHYHTTVTEINLITHGRMKLQDKILITGDIFILEPWEITNAYFIEDTGVICVKTPSVNDKHNIEIVD